VIFRPMRKIRNVQDIAAAGVDDGGAFISRKTGKLLLIIQMDMTVHQIGRVICIQKIPQGGEALMGGIFTVTQTLCRCVGQYQIHTACTPNLIPQSLNSPLHLTFRVLVRTGMVLPAAAKT